MSTAQINQAERGLTTPRAAAVAGILFAVFYTTAQILIRLAIPENPTDSGALLSEQAESISVALSLVPLSGIAFLWFVGVVRDRLGEHEDRFYTTLFLGSSILYLALVFVSAAITGGLLASYATGSVSSNDQLFVYGRSLMHQITNIYGLRMASVVMTSLGTILLRTGIMPRWSAIVTTILAIILMVSISLNVWIKFLFPAWVLMISLLILVANYRRSVHTPAGIEVSGS